MSPPTDRIRSAALGLWALALPWLALAAVFLYCAPARAVDCTDGTDCPCDCATNTDGTGNDVGNYANASCQTKGWPKRPRNVACEDWEAITLYDGRGTGAKGETGPGSGGTACTPGNDSANCYSAGAPLYGPTYDDSRFAGQYGSNSYWIRVWGQNGISPSCSLTNGQPASPTYGDPSTAWGGDGASPAVWRAGNLWSSNSYDDSCVAILRAGEADDEVSIGGPTAPHDGKQFLGQRVVAGHLTGTAGYKTWTKAATSVSMAMAYAIPNNLQSSGIVNGPWKHFGWNNTDHHLFTGYVNENGYGLYPFDKMVMYMPAAKCSANAANATLGLGTSDECADSTKYRYWPSGSTYSRASMMPTGTWTCVRGSVKGLGTSSGSIRIWVGSEQIVSISNLDLTDINGTDENGLASFSLNQYPNSNQGSPGDVPTDETTYRYMDVLQIDGWTTAECATDGAACAEPPTCAEIGFDAGSPTLSIDSITPSPSTGAPTLVVDLAFTLGGTATGDATLQADCDNSGTYEVSLLDTSAPWAIVGACSFGTAGTKTIPVKVTREGVTATSSTSVEVVAPVTFQIDSISASPSSGTAPVNDVDLTFTVSGTATGNVTLEADCGNDGTYEVSAVDTGSPWALADACDFAAAGTKTVPVRATRETVTDTDSVQVTVSAPAGAPTLSTGGCGEQ